MSGGSTDSRLMGLQVRGFWLGPWLKNEAADAQKVFADLMGYLADGTIRPDSGASLATNRFLLLLE